MASRWTQEQEDSYRLPEGFKRTEYDADTRRYIFCDKYGALYQSQPGVEYGTLTPLASSTSAIESVRPSAFALSSNDGSRTLPSSQESGPRTFQDILPPELITSSSLSNPNSHRSHNSSKPPRDKLVEAVRRSAMPKVQGVVNNLRRSVTAMRKPRAITYAADVSEEDSRRLTMHRDSTLTTGSDRSASIDTSLTDNHPDSKTPVHHSKRH